MVWAQHVDRHRHAHPCGVHAEEGAAADVAQAPPPTRHTTQCLWAGQFRQEGGDQRLPPREKQVGQHHGHDGQRKIAIFEDPNCGYCKRFERDLQGVDNVTIHLFLYPILGPDSLAKSRGMDPAVVADLLPVLVLGAVLGARIYYVALEWRQYAGNWGDIPMLPHPRNSSSPAWKADGRCSWPATEWTPS